MIQEPNEGLDVLKGKIETLEGENIALKDMIATLDSRIYALEPHGPPTPTLPDFYQKRLLHY